MKVFVIKNPNIDLRQFPNNSAIIYNDCIYLKKSDKYALFKDIPQELLECKSKSELPEVKTKLDPEENITINEMDCFRVIIQGELVDNLGGTITDLKLIDKLGNEIKIEKEWVFDINVNANLDENADWSFWNMFNDDIIYTDSETGAKSSALFNKGQKDGFSEFYVKPPKDVINILSSIQLLVGSPEGRLPKSIDIYLEKNIDDPERKIETLLIHKAFDLEIDSVQPKKLVATQYADIDNPCLFLFSNGYTDSGFHFIVNPTTGKLEAIYCEFPPILIPPKENSDEFDEFLNSLCEKDPNTIILIKYDNGTYEEYSIKEYLSKYDWVCEINGCDGIKNDFELYDCKKKICDAFKRNPNTLVHTFDKNGNPINMNISDYINLHAIDCENLTFTLSKPLNELNIDELKSLLDEINKMNVTFMSIIDPKTQEKYNIPLPDFKQKVIEQLEKNDPNFKNSEQKITYLYKNKVELNDEKPEIILENDGFIPQEIEEKEKLENGIPIASFYSSYPIDKNSLNLYFYNLNPETYNIEYTIEQKPIEVPLFDKNNNPIDEDGDGEQDTQTVYLVTINIKNISNINLTDFNNEENIEIGLELNGKIIKNLKLNVYKPIFNIQELSSFNQFFTKPLKKIDENTYLKKFEYDENGVVLKFFGAKNYIAVTGLDEDEFDIKIEYDDLYKPSQGTIYIKPKLSPENIDKINLYNCKITDLNSEINLTLYVTKHLRINDIDNKNYYESLGYLMVGDKVEFEIFNDENFYLYNDKQLIASRGGGLSDPSYFNGCEWEKENNKAILKAIHKSVEPNRYFHYYIVDSYFNYRNVLNGTIDMEDVIYYKVDARVKDVIKTSVDKLVIDKYRFFNSKNGFDPNYLSKLGIGVCKTADIIIENFGNGFDISVDKDLGFTITEVNECPNEWMYYEGKYGYFKPLKLRIDTDENTETGNFNLILKDDKSEKIIPIEIIEFIDVELPYLNGVYNIGDILINETKEINFLHPHNNIVNVSSINNYVDFEIDKENNKIKIIPKHVGEETILLGDDLSINKIKANIIYPTTLYLEYNIYEIEDNDTENHIIKYYNNESSNIEIYEYDSDNLDITLDIENNCIYVRNKSGNIGEYQITIVEKLDTGDRYASATIKIVNHLTHISSTPIYINSTSDNEEIINEIPLKLSQEASINNDIEIIKVETTDGINAWLEINNAGMYTIKYQVEPNVFFGTIYVYYSNGDINKIPIVVKPEWDLKDEKIVFVNIGE
jgi:hypothetical protein